MGRKIKSLFILISALFWLPTGWALADVYTSPNYSFNESQVGNVGGGLQSSTNYQAYLNAGDLTVGNATSNNYQIESGFNTTAAPFLEVFVASGTIDLGTLSTTATATTTATFHVRDYLSSGYIVQTVAAPPEYINHSINAPATPTASAVGTEQFGMNLAGPNNVGAGNFGANPAQVPDATFGFGFAATGYNTANLFKYVSGDTIARSNKSSGETDFTISYIFNISNLTPGGIYTYNQNLVVTATY